MYQIYFQGGSLRNGTEGKGHSRMTAGLWLEQLQDKKMVGGAVVVNMGGHIRSLVLFFLSLRCLLDIKSELFRKQLDI